MGDIDHRPDDGAGHGGVPGNAQPGNAPPGFTAQASVPGQPERAKLDFQTWTAVATLFAIVIYGAARFGDTAFYGRLGTDVDSVGLNYGVTLARVGTTIAVSATGVLVLFLYGRHMARPSEERRTQGFWSKVFMTAAVVLAFAISLILLILIIPPAAVPMARVRDVIALAGAVALIFAGNKYEKLRRATGSFDSLRVFMGISVGVALLFGIAALTGYHSAGYIMRDEPLPCPCVGFLGHNITLPWSSGTNGFLGIDAELADVTWIGPGRDTVPEHAILLGQSDDSVVLFDTSRESVLVVPADDVMVRPLSNLTGWNER
jgi:hypothetical protein